MAIAHILPRTGRNVHSMRQLSLPLRLAERVAVRLRNAMQFRMIADTPVHALTQDIECTLAASAAAYANGDEYCVMPSFVLFYGRVDRAYITKIVRGIAGDCLTELTVTRGRLPATTLAYYVVEPPQLHNPPHA